MVYEMDIGCGEKAVVSKGCNSKWTINIKRPCRTDRACLMPTWEPLDSFISFIQAVKFLKENALNIC